MGKPNTNGYRKPNSKTRYIPSGLAGQFSYLIQLFTSVIYLSKCLPCLSLPRSPVRDLGNHVYGLVIFCYFAFERLFENFEIKTLIKN